MLTVNQILDAYERTGCFARQDQIFDERTNCACGLGVLLYEKFGKGFMKIIEKRDDQVNAMAELLGIDLTYAREFVAGFDHTFMRAPSTDGYLLGRQVWEACIREELDY